MIKGYFVEFKKAIDKYSMHEQAFLTKDEYNLYKKSVRILKLYSDIKMVKK